VHTLAERWQQHPLVEAVGVLQVHQVPDGRQAGLPRGEPPARQVRLPLQRRQQRPVRLRGGGAEAEQVSRRIEARRRHPVRQPPLRLLRRRPGTARAGRQEARRHQRGAAGLRPRGAAERRGGRVLRRAEPARVRLRRRPGLHARRPRRQAAAAGLRLLARRLLRPLGGDLRRPAGGRVHGHRRRVLRRREARRGGALPAQRHGVRQPRPARVLGRGAPEPAGRDADRPELLRQPPGAVHRAHQLQAAGSHKFMIFYELCIGLYAVLALLPPHAFFCAKV
jgi:hypothetical protein